MTQVQQRVVALLAAFVLAIGCGIAAVVPQQHAFAADTKLTAGTSFGAATNLAMTGTGLSATNKTQFNASYDNNFYKFTTSPRTSSTYRLSLLSYNGNRYRMYMTVYDAQHRRIANMRVSTATTKTWLLQNLKPNSVYYVEVWCYITSVDGFIAAGDVDGNGWSDFRPMPYKIYLSERTSTPSLTGLTVASNKNHHITVSWNEPAFNVDRVQIQFWWSWQANRTTKNSFVRTAPAEDLSYTTKVRYFGNKRPYKVRIRPYQIINGKNVYGSWTYLGTANRWNKTYKAGDRAVFVKPLSIENVVVTSKKSKYLNVTWKPLGAGDGVQIRLKRNGWGANKYFDFTAKASDASFSHNTGYTKAKYKVAIRAYHTFQGKRYYGPWMTWKTAKGSTVWKYFKTK